MLIERKFKTLPQHLSYNCSAEKMEIKVKTNQDIIEPTAFVLPIVSPANEVVTHVSENEIAIQKSEGLVIIKATSPIKIKDMEGSRTFNMVPGVEALPLEVFFEEEVKELQISITVS